MMGPRAHTCLVECSTGSTEASLHITASWDGSGPDLDLHVVEPGGVEVDSRSLFLRELRVRRSFAIEVFRIVSAATHLRSSIPDPKTDFQLKSSGIYICLYIFIIYIYIIFHSSLSHPEQTNLKNGNEA